MKKDRVNSKSGFSDPDRINHEREKDKPMDGKKSPWDFRCPQYDQRSSNFVNAGTNYGVGYTQPIGHLGDPAEKARVFPHGRVKTMRDDEEV